MAAQYLQLLETYDFIVSPATSIPAFEAGLEVPSGSGPSVRPHAAGLPIGFEIIGAWGKDANVRALAARLEEVFAS